MVLLHPLGVISSQNLHAAANQFIFESWSTVNLVGRAHFQFHEKKMQNQALLSHAKMSYSPFCP